jgi:hypothetical protein
MYDGGAVAPGTNQLKIPAISGTFEPLLGGDRQNENCVAKAHNPLQRGSSEVSLS